MIVFELKCGNGHRFEAWFRNGATYDAQAASGDIFCPECADNNVSKAPMAPRLLKSRGEAEAPAQPPAPPEAPDRAGEAQAMMRMMLRQLRSHVEANADYVGSQFPEQARRIHYGESEARPIYGEATKEEAAALRDEGVEVQDIPWIQDDA